jgi:hypothetical protein
LGFGAAGVEVDGVEGLVVFYCAAVELGAGVGGLWAQALGEVAEGGLRLRRWRLARGGWGGKVGWYYNVLIAVREVLFGIIDLGVRVADFFDAGVGHFEFVWN